MTVSTLVSTLDTAQSAREAAQAAIDAHRTIEARKAALEAAAAAGDLDHEGAADLVDVTERHRVSSILDARRAADLEGATKAEVDAALAVLAEKLAEAVALRAEAETAGIELLKRLISPAAMLADPDHAEGHARDLALMRTVGMFTGHLEARELVERIEAAQKTTWGSHHVPTACREILDAWAAATAAIKDGTARLTAAGKAAKAK